MLPLRGKFPCVDPVHRQPDLVPVRANSRYAKAPLLLFPGAEFVCKHPLYLFNRPCVSRGHRRLVVDFRLFLSPGYAFIGPHHVLRKLCKKQLPATNKMGPCFHQRLVPGLQGFRTIPSREFRVQKHFVSLTENSSILHQFLEVRLARLCDDEV